MATILMRKGTLQHEVAEHDVQRWEGYGYEVVIAPLPSDGGKEVAGDADVSPVAPTVVTKKRTPRKKKEEVQKDDQS